MKNALLLHGTYGDHLENWLPWLSEKMSAKGYKVWVPDLPESGKPNIDRYSKFIFPQWKFDHDSILIGHSSGAVAILGLLQKLSLDIVVDLSILVSGFVDENLTDYLFTKVPQKNFVDLFPRQWDWTKIKKQCKKFIILHSPDDPYVQIRHAKILQAKLSGKLLLIPGSSHFSTGTGGERFKKFPEILEFIP